MFGYVRPAVPELRVREYAGYRAFYCGICRGLGEQCGPACRLFLQYDFVLLAMVLDLVLPQCATIERKRCSVAAWRRLPAAGGEAIAYAADAHGLLLLGKSLDDREDKGKARFLYAPLKHWTRSAAGRRPELARAVMELVARQREAETAGAHLEAATEPFAHFCSAMFAPPDAPKEYREALCWLGLNVGRWIGIVDALDDYERDKRRNAFNPLRQPTREEAVSAALPAMGLCVKQAAVALDVLPDRRYADIARNILEEGLYDVAESIAQGTFHRRRLQMDAEQP